MTVVRGAVEVRSRLTLALKVLNAELSAALELRHWSKLDRGSGTGLGTRRRQAGAGSVVAQCALHSRVVGRVDLNDIESASADAVSAAIEHIRLDLGRILLGTNNR